MTPFFTLYRLFLRIQLTTGRLVLIGALSAIAIILGLATGGNDPFDPVEDAAEVIWFFGIGLMVPIISLVLSSSSFGDLQADETLVYLWHRKTPRWQLAAAAWLAPATIAVPANALGLVLCALLITGFSAKMFFGTLAAVVVAAIVYSAVFTLLGLLFRQALIIGLMYLIIWEQFLARAGGGAATLSILTYPSSVLAKITDVELFLADRSLAVGLIVPAVLSILALVATSRRLDHMDVA